MKPHRPYPRRGRPRRLGHRSAWSGRAWRWPSREPIQEIAHPGRIDGPIDAAAIGAARRLFARAIETPGGLKIQTIHSFCASILRHYPLEAGVSPVDLDDLVLYSIYDKLAGGMDRMPPGASPPLVKRRSIDDVPVLALTLWSRDYDWFELRRVAAELSREISDVDNISDVKLIGGQRRPDAGSIEVDGIDVHRL